MIKNKTSYIHGSLFSGTGGFDYAAELMGWKNVFHCESDPFCRKILDFYWPQAMSYEDIKDTNFSVWRGRITVLSGGFPCQPYSSAGNRKGKADERHLWPHMLRAIQEIRPTWVVGENVRGLINWNGGLVFDEIQTDLENSGYKVFPFLLPACGINAPHQRYRIFFIAYSECAAEQSQQSGGGQRRKPTDYVDDEMVRQGFRPISAERIKRAQESRDASDTSSDRWRGNWQDAEEENREQRLHEAEKLERGSEGLRSMSDASDTNSSVQQGSQQYRGSEEPRETQGESRQPGRSICGQWESFPTQSPVRGRNDGLPDELDGITISKWSSKSIKGYGNAIVPELVLQIFKTIELYDSLK